jgi:hypothetical protein
VWNRTRQCLGEDVPVDVLEEALFGRVYALTFPESVPTNDILRQLSSEPAVAIACPNAIWRVHNDYDPNDTLWQYQWGPHYMHMDDAWDLGDAA